MQAYYPPGYPPPTSPPASFPFNPAHGQAPMPSSQWSPPPYNPPAVAAQTLPPVSGLGLPSKPTVTAPPANSRELEQMHQGQYVGSAVASRDPRQRPPPVAGAPEQLPQQPNVPTESEIDDMIAEGRRAAEAARQSATPSQAPAAPEDAAAKQAPPKKGKGDKDKGVRLVYTDNVVSPEEKMANLAKYTEAMKLAEGLLAMKRLEVTQN